jgi:hypothetical protein
MDNYRKHLYFESDLESREYAINRCMSILGLIASCKDSFARKNNKELIQRLEKKFNNALKKIKEFEVDYKK